MPASDFTGKQIRDESLTGADVQDGTIAELDLAVAVRTKLNAGDMLRATYDATGTAGIVDNAEALGGAPANLYARRDTANTFTVQQILNAGLYGGLDTGPGNALRSLTRLVLPRENDFDSIAQDYQDEAALAHLNPAWTTTITSAAVAGVASPLFIDDSTFYSNSGTVFPVVVTADFGAAPIPHRNNGNFRLGLTLRGSVLPTSILIETWNGTAYATVVNATGLTAADFTPGLFWLSAAFVGNSGTANMDKVRVTLSGANPTAAAFGFQRMILYHATSTLNPWHVHRLGGTMYGDLSMTNGATVRVNGNAVYHPGNLTPGATMPVRTVTANYTVLLSDAVIFVDATAGPVTITLPTAASAIVGGQGQRVRVKKIDVTANAVTITATGGQIDGAPSAVISTPYNAFEFSPIPSSTNWGGF